MVTSPHGGLDRSNHLGNLLHHFVHDFCGRLPNGDVEGLSCHNEAHCLMNGCASGRCVVHWKIGLDTVTAAEHSDSLTH